MNRVLGTFVIAILATGRICAAGGPTATVNLNREIAPRTPLSEKHMLIAVMNARMEGDTTEFDQSKWSEMTANLIQGKLEQAAEQHRIPIKLVDREHLKMTMGEKDLASAGVTDSGDRTASSKVQGANAILTSKVTIKIDKQKGKGRTIDAIGAIGWARGGGGNVAASEVDKESRNITVQCQFQLKDAGTNEIIVSHNGMPSEHFDKAKTPSPFFGGSKTESNMAPRDKVIAVMIEEQAQDFLCKFVPVQTCCSVQVQPSRNKESVAGVRNMVTDDYESALNHFRQAIAANPDDHESCFGAGVCLEKLNRADEALKQYKLAQSIKPKEAKYNEAVQRVSRM